MSVTVASPVPVYVQTQFVWDEKLEELNCVGVSIPDTHPLATRSVATGRRKLNSQRSGRCEHVGSALVSVLGQYGIGLDQLLDEIERQKAITKSK